MLFPVVWIQVRSSPAAPVIANSHSGVEQPVFSNALKQLAVNNTGTAVPPVLNSQVVPPNAASRIITIVSCFAFLCSYFLYFIVSCFVPSPPDQMIGWLFFGCASVCLPICVTKL